MITKKNVKLLKESTHIASHMKDLLQYTAHLARELDKATSIPKRLMKPSSERRI